MRSMALAGTLHRHTERFEERLQQPSIGDTHHDVARRKAELAHDVHRDRDEFGIRGNVGGPEDVHVQLIVLPKTSLLLAFVAKELGHREPAHGLAQRVGACGHHAGHRRRHLGPQRDLTPTLVDEIVELADDLRAALLRVELEWLQGRTVVLDEGVATRHVAPRIHDEGALGQFLRIEVAKAG